MKINRATSCARLSPPRGASAPLLQPHSPILNLSLRRTPRLRVRHLPPPTQRRLRFCSGDSQRAAAARALRAARLAAAGRAFLRSRTAAPGGRHSSPATPTSHQVTPTSSPRPAPRAAAGDWSPRPSRVTRGPAPARRVRSVPCAAAALRSAPRRSPGLQARPRRRGRRRRRER